MAMWKRTLKFCPKFITKFLCFRWNTSFGFCIEKYCFHKVNQVCENLRGLFEERQCFKSSLAS